MNPKNRNAREKTQKMITAIVRYFKSCHKPHILTSVYWTLKNDRTTILTRQTLAYMRFLLSLRGRFLEGGFVCTFPPNPGLASVLSGNSLGSTSIVSFLVGTVQIAGGSDVRFKTSRTVATVAFIEGFEKYLGICGRICGTDNSSTSALWCGNIWGHWICSATKGTLPPERVSIFVVTTFVTTLCPPSLRGGGFFWWKGLETLRGSAECCLVLLYCCLTFEDDAVAFEEDFVLLEEVKEHTIIYSVKHCSASVLQLCLNILHSLMMGCICDFQKIS